MSTKTKTLLCLALVLAAVIVAGCNPQPGTPGYSLAGPSGNSTGYARPVQQTESGSATTE